MDKLRVGVIMEDCLPTEGGGYSYYQTLLSAINRHTFHQDIEIININFDKTLPKHLLYNKRLMQVEKDVAGTLAYLFLKLLYKLIHRLLGNHAPAALDLIAELMDAINNRAAKKILLKENIHLVYYLKPKDNLVNYPMIVTHWDVGHKSMYPFPEVAWNGNFEKRENYYQKILSRAFLILCESETGARELQYYYPVNPNKIKVFPYFSGDVVSQVVSKEEQEQILNGYGLMPKKFYFYPAQFWAHKNHYTLIHAFRSLLNDQGNESLQLVLCGGDQGNLSYIKILIETLDMEKNILLPGFVSIRNLHALYRNAIALVMPTFLGPTNIPLIEAAELNCAIICSNLEGHREILGDSTLYFDPSSKVEIYNCMKQILNSDIRRQLTSAAYNRISNSPFRLEKSIPLLDNFLQQINPIRNTWGINLKLLLVFAKIGILSIN